MLRYWRNLLSSNILKSTFIDTINIRHFSITGCILDKSGKYFVFGLLSI